MNIQNEKCVMVLNEELPLGILANTTGIMGITLGKYIPETVGVTVLDKSQHPHLGIITTPVPILKTTQDKIKQIRQQLYLPDFKELIDLRQGLCRRPRQHGHGAQPGDELLRNGHEQRRHVAVREGYGNLRGRCCQDAPQICRRCRQGQGGYGALYQ